MGEKNKQLAIRHSFTGVTFATICNALVTVLGAIFAKNIAEFFIIGETGLDLFISLFPFFLLMLWGESLQVALSGVLRGIGLAETVNKDYFVCLFGVG